MPYKLIFHPEWCYNLFVCISTHKCLQWWFGSSKILKYLTLSSSGNMIIIIRQHCFAHHFSMFKFVCMQCHWHDQAVQYMKIFLSQKVNLVINTMWYLSYFKISHSISLFIVLTVPSPRYFTTLKYTVV